MRDKINNRLVAKAQPKDKPFEVADVDLPGFLLRVQPSGVMNYYARYRLPDGKQTRLRLGSASTLTPAQARDKARRVLADVTMGEDPAAAKRRAKAHTLRTFVEEVYGPWLVANRKRGAETAQVIVAAFPELLDKKLEDINGWHVERWRRELLKKGRSRSTANRYLAYLRGLFSRAVEWDFLAEHPLRKVKQHREDASRVRYLSDDEEQRLMAALDTREERIRAERDSANAWRHQRGYEEFPDLRTVAYVDHVKPLVVLSIHTGMRRGELFGLEWADVDLVANPPTLTVRAEMAKGGIARHVPLNEVAQDVLKAWRAQTSGDGVVFKSPVTGERLDNVRKAWREVLADAKIANFRWHDLRHHFASRLVMAGVDLNTVRELLGHSDLKMTLRYAHLAPEHKAEAVGRLVSRSNVVPFKQAQNGSETPNGG